MRDPAASRVLPGRAFASLAFLVLLTPVLFSPAGRADDPPERLTTEQRQELQRQALELYNASKQAHERGDLTTAVEKARQLLRIMERLYPKDRYPQGHSDLAAGLNNLGMLLRDRREYGEARGYYQRALAIYEAVYTRDRFPRGHSDLANSLHNLGYLLHVQGNYGEARGYYRRALAMREALYPSDRYPQGHSRLAQSLNSLGYLLQDQGDYSGARGYYRRALAMREALYPSDRYPQGHPDLANSLNNLAHLLEEDGQLTAAWPLLQRAVNMYQDGAELLQEVSSEAESQDYLASLPGTIHGLLAVSCRLPDQAEATYTRVWRHKAAVARIIRSRQAALTLRAGADPDTRAALESWRDTRRQLARLLLATSDGRDDPGRVERLRSLTAEKERLERALAAAVPEFARERSLAQSPPARLIEALPAGTIVLDLVAAIRREQDPKVRGEKGRRFTPGYVGFVLARGRPVHEVDLGPAQPINEAVQTWRAAIEQRQGSPAAEILRRTVWEPLACHFPPGTTTVLVALDGDLTAVPWGALPGDRPGTVLLEQYALATAPHAPFLLDRLTAPPQSSGAGGQVLAVGGVDYDGIPKPLGDPAGRTDLLALRPAETGRGPGGNGWKSLPGTAREVEAVAGLAAPRPLLRLEGTEAGTARLLRELPKARWAHIATHGFFANPEVRSILQPDPRLFAFEGRERAAGLRNPLVLSGLVLAGANRPAGPQAHRADDDLGIVTAEAIAGLPLPDLELVVLSACDTGLGLVGGGEGVFGLQRAFHLAGAHNVVASLWKVDDEATAALMAIFYDQLWRQGKPPIEALRAAQLTLYYHPELAGRLAKARGTPDFDKLVQRPEPVPGAGGPGPRQADTKDWAAFVLSGWGK
jgi:CHAT domain-containing protein/tetratricopeptide (TPR) repeat protein